MVFKARGYWCPVGLLPAYKLPFPPEKGARKVPVGWLCAPPPPPFHKNSTADLQQNKQKKEKQKQNEKAFSFGDVTQVK